MSDQPETDTTEAGAEGQDNTLIQDLRRQVKEAKAAAKAAQAAVESAKVEARQQLERETAAQRIVDAAGYPGLTEIVLDKVEGEPTADTVRLALEALQLPIPEDYAQRVAGGVQPQTESAPGPAVNPQAVAETSSLGARVAAAAQVSPESNLVASIGAAQTMEELVAAVQQSGSLDQGGIYDPS